MYALIFILCMVVQPASNTEDFPDISAAPPNIDDVVLEAHIPEQNVESKALVLQLGDPDHGVRNKAFLALKKLDINAVIAISEGQTNPDLEIKHYCRRLITEMRYVTPTKMRFYGQQDLANWPSIWALPNRLRYQSGHDVAEEYYKKAFIDSGKEANELVVFDFGTVNNLPEDKQLAALATIKYVGDLRQNGLPAEDAVALLNRMIWNAQLLHIMLAESKPPTLLLDKSSFWLLILLR